MDVHMPEQRAPAAASSAGGRQDHKVVGYSPTLITQAAKDLLGDFRRLNLRVDLRLERALATGCAQLCLDEPALHRPWYPLARSVADTLHVPGGDSLLCLGPVLVRTRHMRRAAAMAMAWELGRDERAAATPLLSAAIELVTRDASLHGQLIEIVASTVAWEVRAGFQGGARTF